MKRVKHLEEPYTPITVDGVDMAFPANVGHLMPDYETIPEEFRRWNLQNKWQRCQADWFYNGLESLKIDPRDGIDKNAAMRHLGCIQRSFEPKHEHKEAAIAFLASLWFKDVKYTVKERKK